MDAHTCIRTKRDSRAYTDQAIPEESLERILQAGRMAGSSKNTQPWRFVVLRDAERPRRRWLSRWCSRRAAATSMPAAPPRT